MAIRRAVFTRHNRSPEPGSITLLAPHNKEGMERMYSDLARAMRLVKPDPMAAEARGSDELAKEMNKGSYRATANPLDEDDFIAAAAQDFDAEELRANRERVQHMGVRVSVSKCVLLFDL